MTQQRKTFYEFFAGGGMVNAALRERGWECVFANDIDEKKASAYKANWGGEHLRVGDVHDVKPSDLPGVADLSWGSFPCQDLSLAGDYIGLSGERSGTFWPFWKLMRRLMDEGRGPRTIVLENVYGAVTSHGGKDFEAIAKAFSGAGYRFGALIMDAVHWVPQSRPRLFVIGVRGNVSLPASVLGEPSELWHWETLRAAHERLSSAAKKRWVWWNMPRPPSRNQGLVDLIEEKPTGTEWHSKEETEYIISLMAPLHQRKLQQAIAITKNSGGRLVGGIYRRTREGRQRAEVRFDDVAGCLRTPTGGSSRQTIMLVTGGEVRSRLLSTREAARLMGLPDEYKLPTRYNEAYHLCGDGVAVPAVQYIAEHILEPILGVATPIAAIAAE